jgi:hypothetical protein
LRYSRNSNLLSGDCQRSFPSTSREPDSASLLSTQQSQRVKNGTTTIFEGLLIHMCSLPLEQFVSVGKDVLVAVAAAVGAAVAVLGLNTWNRQLKGSAEYDFARRILKITYRLRDAMTKVRHPAMWAAEMPQPPPEEAKSMSGEEIFYYRHARAYQARWQ